MSRHMTLGTERLGPDTIDDLLDIVPGGIIRYCGGQLPLDQQSMLNNAYCNMSSHAQLQMLARNDKGLLTNAGFAPISKEKATTIALGEYFSRLDKRVNEIEAVSGTMPQEELDKWRAEAASLAETSV